MQRNISYQITLKAYLWAIALIVYSFFIPVYPYLPSFVGLVVLAAYVTRSWLWIITAGIYLLLYEADRDYIFLSEGLVVVLWWFVVYPFFKEKVICKVCVPVGGIVIFYLLQMVVMTLIALIFMRDYTVNFVLMCYYGLIDSLLAIILFG